tara:strand:+ start:283 stop:516 length:234 start_codon:yes stop_codon:yes gene_type:complete
MTDISLYKNVSLPHDAYRKAKLLSIGVLVKDGDISISKVVEILVSRAAKAHGISEDQIAKVDVTSRKKKRKVNGKGK